MRQVVICDFDETITDRDTIGILGELPYVVKPGFKPGWSHFTNTYMTNYNTFLENPTLLGCEDDLQRSLPLLPSKVVEITPRNFLTLFKDEIRYQTNARNLEASSTSEMAKCGLFEGINHFQVSQFVQEKLKDHSFALRNGFKDFLALTPAERFFVISVNWSTEFIKGAIGEDSVYSHNIYCNRLLSNRDTYTGQFSNELLTGSDKVKVLDKIIKEQEHHGEQQEYWYVGDSETDLLALLHPEVNGVLLIDPNVKEEKLRKIAIKILGLNEDLINRFICSKDGGWFKCFAKNQENSFYLAKSWFDLTNIYSNNR